MEPSTLRRSGKRPDVWNRRGTSPGTFPNDQPDNEPAGNGTGAVGDNWAFARIRRRAASPAGATTVTAHFLVSQLGTGSNSRRQLGSTLTSPSRTRIPRRPSTRPTWDPITTTPFHWHLEPGRLVAPVPGRGNLRAERPDTWERACAAAHPGWPGQDLEILDDNNKAQRNMGLSVTPARGVESCEAALFGIVHNAATVRRDLVLEYVVPDSTRRRVETVRIEATGIRRFAAQPQGRIVLDGMEPGENRWLSVSFKPPNGRIRARSTSFDSSRWRAPPRSTASASALGSAHSRTRSGMSPKALTWALASSVAKSTGYS